MLTIVSITGSVDIAGTSFSASAVDLVAVRHNAAGALVGVPTRLSQDCSVRHFTLRAAIDPNNNLYLAFQFDTPRMDCRILPSNVAISYNNSNDIHVMKFSSSFAFVATSQIATQGFFNLATTIAVSNDSSVYVAGSYSSAASVTGFTFPPPILSNMDTSFLVKFNDNLVPQGGIANFFNSRTDPEFVHALVASGNTVFVVGSYNLAPSMVAKVVANTMTVEWTNGISGNGNSRAESVATDNLGNVYVTGSISGSVFVNYKLVVASANDILLYKLDRDGSLAWFKNFGPTFQVGQAFGMGGQSGKYVVADPDGTSVNIVGSYTIETPLGNGFTLTASVNVDVQTFFAKFSSTTGATLNVLSSSCSTCRSISAFSASTGFRIISMYFDTSNFFHSASWVFYYIPRCYS